MWGMRAYVLARKGILVSDPSVSNMTRAQWVFEYVALSRREQEEREFSIRAMKNILISTLGLNLLRPEDANGVPLARDKMSDEEKDRFVPLVAWVGNDGILQAVKDQIEKSEVELSVPVPDKTYEDMVAAIDAAEGDIEPIIGVEKLDTIGNVKKVHQEKLAGVLARENIDVGEV